MLWYFFLMYLSFSLTVIRFQTSVTKREQRSKNNSCTERVHSLVQWIFLLIVSEKNNRVLMNYNNMCPSSRNPIHKILKKDEKVVVDFVSEIVKKNVHKCVKKTDAWNFSSTLTYICFIP